MTYRSSDGGTSAICIVSKLHKQGGYWYAFHKRHYDQLEQAKDGYVVLGCGSPQRVLVVPWPDFRAWIPGLNTTETASGKSYWHVIIDSESLMLQRRRGEEKIPLKKYLLKQTPS